jgi:uncharacterized surface protein with fasciclin (FAS1) repeats
LQSSTRFKTTASWFAKFFASLLRRKNDLQKTKTLVHPNRTVESLLKPENKEKLVEILKYHVVAGKVMAADVVKLDSAKTLVGKEVTIKVVDGNVLVNASTVAKADVVCDNGVIHVIDAVLLPPAM